MLFARAHHVRGETELFSHVALDPGWPLFAIRRRGLGYDTRYRLPHARRHAAAP